MAITQAEMLKLKEAIKEAEKSETPFPILKDGELAVVGDVNDIGVKKHDYKVMFRFPKSFGIEGKPVGDYIMTEVEFKDKFITGLQDFAVIREMVTLIPFFNNLNEDGSVTERTEEELAEIVTQLNDGIVESIYRVIAAVLEIDDEFMKYIVPMSAIHTIGEIIKNNASAWNEADVFFG